MLKLLTHLILMVALHLLDQPAYGLITFTLTQMNVVVSPKSVTNTLLNNFNSPVLNQLLPELVLSRANLLLTILARNLFGLSTKMIMIQLIFQVTLVLLSMETLLLMLNFNLMVKIVSLLEQDLTLTLFNHINIILEFQEMVSMFTHLLLTQNNINLQGR